MRKIDYKVFTIFLIAVCLLTNVVNISKFVQAIPFEQDIEFLCDYNSFDLLAEKINSHSLGGMASPLKIDGQESKKSSITLPTSFDLRDIDAVTEVKNQGNIGSCWTFSTTAAMESYEKYNNNVIYDFSENNILTHSGFDWSYDDGGNRDMAIAILARGNGPVLEVDDPYANPSYPNNVVIRDNVPNIRRLTDAIYIPERNNYLDNEKLKNCILEYGAVSASIYMDNGSSYNAGKSSYYFSGGSGVNHGITIVGWDDNYSRYNFNSIPKGNGAFIVKNSWGENWGDNGYFYVSYYDTSIAQYGTVFITDKYFDYETIYQYDDFGVNNFINYSSVSEAWFSNVFTSKKSESIKAVSFYTASQNANFTVYLVKNFSGNFENKILIGSGDFLNAGYHTVNLNRKLNIEEGEKYAVIVNVSCLSSLYNIPIEYRIGGYTSNADSEYGQSYISTSGEVWEDLYNFLPKANVCLKVFTEKKQAQEELEISASIAGGTYYESVDVSLTTSRTADIFYTLDGSEPTISSQKYNGQAINISSTTILKFFAVDENNIESGIYTENYIIENIVSPTITYQTHIEKIGWQDWIYDGEIAGTTGKSYRLEALKLKLEDAPESASIRYRAHVQSIGWQPWVSDGEITGTSGKSLRIEAIEIELVNMPGYSVQYQGHVQSYGWQNWVQNRMICGTTGEAKRVEALKIKIVKDPVTNPDTPNDLRLKCEVNDVELSWDVSVGATSYNIYRADAQNGTYIEIGKSFTNKYSDKCLDLGKCYYYKVSACNSSGESNKTEVKSIETEEMTISYQGHVQKIGWQNWASNGELAGIEGKAYRMEAIKIKIDNALEGVEVEYRAHVQSIGWQEWVSNGDIAGTYGKGLRIESLQIRLKNAPEGYHILYQGHVQGKGWTNWISDGKMCGSTGEALRLEAIRIKLVKVDPNTVPLDLLIYSN